MILAAVMREDAVLMIFYLVAGMYIVGRWWSRRSLRAVSFERIFTRRAFLGETIPVSLNLKNSGWLPTLWLNLHESLPLELVSPNFFRQIVHLGSKEETTYHYTLYAQKRGYYQVGPIFLRTGDLVGLAEDHERTGASDILIVYPKIVPLAHIGLPTRSPFGTLRHNQPIFEDPSRVIGKRDYQSGDSLRHVDWKSSAASQSLLVKKFEPSIALETIIFLDLYAPGYELRTRIDTTELAIVVAASVANWVIEKKQAVGLCTNGIDPLQADQVPVPLPARKGRGHLMTCLDILARVQTAKTLPIADRLEIEGPNLPWGTTLVLITGQIDDPTFDRLFQLRRSGIEITLILVGVIPGFEDLKLKARKFGFVVYRVAYLVDLEPWRG